MKDNLFDTKSAVVPPAQVVIDGIDPDSPQAQALLADNIDVINQFIAVQRRNYSLNILNIHKASVRTPEIGIVYQNQFGRETIRLTPYPVYLSETPEVLEQPTVPQLESIQLPPPVTVPLTSDLYMMVLYATNMIAAIPMSTLPAAAPTYNGLSADSNWLAYNTTTATVGANQIPVAQYQFGAVGVILTPVNFTSGQAAATDYQLWTTRLTQNVIYDGMATQLVLADQTTQFSYGTPTSLLNTPPIMSGTADMIYTAFDVYSMDNEGKLARVNNGGDVNVPPYCISSDGDYYYNPTWADQLSYPGTAINRPGGSQDFFCVLDLEGSQCRRGMNTNALPDSNNTTADAALLGSSSTANNDPPNSFNFGFMYSSHSNVDSEATITITYTTGAYDFVSGVYEVTYPFNPDFSGSVPYPQFRNSNTGSSVQLIAEMIPVTATVTYSNVDTSVERADSINIFDVTYNFSNSGAGYVGGNLPAIQLQPFPPSLSATPPGGISKYYYASLDNRLDHDALPVSTLAITTPYGTFTGLTPTSFVPWLHVSNAVHYAQGFVIDGVPSLYLDGREWFSTLLAALNAVTEGGGLTATDIHAIYMDISLATIQTLNNIQASIPPIS
jgi:hypothetical protein